MLQIKMDISGFNWLKRCWLVTPMGSGMGSAILALNIFRILLQPLRVLCSRYTVFFLTYIACSRICDCSQACARLVLGFHLYALLLILIAESITKTKSSTLKMHCNIALIRTALWVHYCNSTIMDSETPVYRYRSLLYLIVVLVTIR